MEGEGVSYRVRVLRGTLELDFPGRKIEPPRAPAQLGPLVLMALSPGREIPLEMFKAKLYDCDPIHVSNAAIQTPIARLRQAGLPVPLRRYVLEVEPSEVDIVDLDTRVKAFIETVANLDRMGPDEAAAEVERGMQLHRLWQEDPAAAVGNSPQLAALFEAHRRRHRRFGMALVRLMAQAGEPERALGMLEHYVDRYGEDESWSELEWRLLEMTRPELSRPLAGPDPRAAERSEAVVPGPPERITAFEEVAQMLAASSRFPLSELVVSSHNLDLVYSVDKVVVADDQERIDTPVESPGGSGANTGVGLARLGMPVGVAGIVARDREGTILRRDFLQEQIDSSNLLVVNRSAGRTGHAYIFTDRQGRRATYIHPGINERWASELLERPGGVEQLRELGSNARILHFSSFYGHAEREQQQALLAALPEAVVVSFDPGTMYSPMGLDRLSAFMLRCNILQVYEHQLHVLVANSSAEPHSGYNNASARADLQALLRWRQARGGRGPLVVLVKKHRMPGEESKEVLGFETMAVAAGRHAVEDLVSPQAPHWRVPVLADTTGAGDAMAAGLHYGMLNGASAADCVDLAYVMAMAASSDYGCRAGLVREDVLPDAWQQYLPAADLPGWLLKRVG